MKIYHNLRCRKSRETLAIIEEKGIDPDVILYLEQNITQKELKAILKKLGMKASEILRKGEQIYKTITEAKLTQRQNG